MCFFDLRRQKENTFLLVLKSNSMFCEHCFLSQVKNIGSTRRYFHTFPFQGCFVFHLMLFFKGFIVLSDLLKAAFVKSSKDNNSWQILKNNQIINTYHTDVLA